MGLMHCLLLSLLTWGGSGRNGGCSRMWQMFTGGLLTHHWKESKASVRDYLETWHEPGVINARVGRVTVWCRSTRWSQCQKSTYICKHYCLVLWFFRHHFELKQACMIVVAQIKSRHYFLHFFLGILFYITQNNCSLFPFLPSLLPYLKRGRLSY